MKYLIGNKVINADHIVEVIYEPEVPDAPEPANRSSRCTIETTNDAYSDYQYLFRVRGEQADRFWKEYSGDAIDVMKIDLRDYDDAQ